MDSGTLADGVVEGLAQAARGSDAGVDHTLEGLIELGDVCDTAVFQICVGCGRGTRRQWQICILLVRHGSSFRRLGSRRPLECLRC